VPRVGWITARRRDRRDRAGRAAAAAALPLALAAACAHAATPQADAEQLLQEQRERVLREREEAVPHRRLETPLPAPARRIPPDERPCVVVRRIRLEVRDPAGGAAAAGLARRFRPALAAADAPGDPARGRCLGARGIGVVARRVQNALIARGYVTTRVLVRPQDLSGGTLTLTVIPGRVGRIRLAPGSGARARLANAFPLRPGDLLDLRALEEALESLERLPGVRARIDIAPGPRSGESDLVVGWEQRRPLRATLALDDAGTRATGRYQGSLTFAVGHPLRLNDLAYVTVGRELGLDGDWRGAGRGTRSLAAHWSLPLAGWWRLAFTTSRFRYHQTVAGAVASYVYSGRIRRWEAELARTVHRDRTSRTRVYAALRHERYRSFIEDVEIAVQRRRMTLVAAGVRHDRFLRRGSLRLEAELRRGTGALGAMRAPEEATGEGTARPRLATARAALDLRLRPRLRWRAEARAQWHRTPLVPQHRFAIGSRWTVRGFDGERLLAADSGWLLRDELAWAPRAGVELYAALDHGRVRGPSARLLAGRRLTGAAVGLRGRRRGLDWEVFVGWPLEKPAGFRTDAVTAGFRLAWTRAAG